MNRSIFVLLLLHVDTLMKVNRISKPFIKPANHDYTYLYINHNTKKSCYQEKFYSFFCESDSIFAFLR